MPKEIDNLIEDIQEHQELELLEKKFGHLPPLSYKHLAPLELSKEEREIIKENRRKAIEHIRQKYGDDIL